MTATRALDSEWEAQMLDELKSDDELQKKYVAAVENEDSGKPLSKITVQIQNIFSQRVKQNSIPPFLSKTKQQIKAVAFIFFVSKTHRCKSAKKSSPN